MKTGDIVFFREEHFHTYSSIGGDGSRKHIFKTGQAYMIDGIHGESITIFDFLTNDSHFMHGDGIKKLITLREENLNKLEI